MMSTKENILRSLEAKKGESLSGEELASQLEISRTAVWKAIQELRKEGYQIKAITNKGYCLAPSSDVLSAEGIMPYLISDLKKECIHVLKTVDSTNLAARRLALDGAEASTVIIAEEQTKGKGRLGRSFHSPATGGIYMSFILKPKFDPSKAVLITTAAAVAVCDAIEKTTGLSCQIKWVNDVYYNHKKICGILTEAVSDMETGHIESIVLGIGINYSTPANSFPDELSQIAGSLIELAQKNSGFESSQFPVRNQLIGEIINHILEMNNRLESRNFMEEYKKRSFVLGKEIRIIPTGALNQPDSPDIKEAKAIDINQDGALVVAYPDGRIETLNTGEISIRIREA